MSVTKKQYITVTGANGFIGRALTPLLRLAGNNVRTWQHDMPMVTAALGIPENQKSSVEWEQSLRGTDVIVHLAGLAHRIDDNNIDAEERYHIANTRFPILLAKAAINAKVKRFIFISSAKVFGEGRTETYRSNSIPAPHDAYARSKWNAECQLMELAKQNAIELVIIRPPLVYGRDAKANFALLQKLAKLPLPLPFASIDNRRDLIAIDNLIDLIEICLTHPSAAGRIWLCADAHPYSLSDMVTALRAAKSRQPGLFPFPPRMLKSIISTVIGGARAEKIFGDFTIDDRETHELLGWSPRLSMREVLSSEKTRGQQ